MPAELTPAEALDAVANELAFNSGTPEPSFVCMICDQSYRYDGGPWDAMRIPHSPTCPISRLAAAVEDAERLDWLQKDEGAVHHTTAGMWRIETQGRVVPNGPVVFIDHYRNTLRAALDAARTPAPGERP